MCRYQNLAQSRQGYIIKCPKCNCYQLAFGTTLVSLSAGEFEQLSKIVFCEYRLRDAYEDNGSKQVSVSLTENVMMCLTKQELELLADMFHQAAALMETYELIEAV